MFVRIWRCSTTLIWPFPRHSDGHRPIIVVVKTQNPEAVAAATSPAAGRRSHLLNQTTDTIIDLHLARPETRTGACQMIHTALEHAPMRGWPVMRSTAETLACALTWYNTGWGM